MTHEMVHLAFPNVPSAQHWIEEGLATFVEPIARARAGWITEDAVWAEWIENMPLGLPGPGDGGLDGTESWGRTYWGGALFCLVAAVALLERSGGRHSLDDALRAIVAAGGNISTRWPLERALRAGDAATGERVLLDTYASMKDAPVQVDLGALWRKLGVALEAGAIRYDDSAPLARVRRVLVSGGR
jgi:predicted metalloprotease with PDZ domain